MAKTIYYTSKGQPYIKLASGKARFISKRSAGMSGTGALSGKKKRKSPKRRRVGDVGKVLVSRAVLGRLVRATGKCISIISSKGAESFCPSKISVGKKKKAKSRK
jgi:hypothetical protein